MFYEYNYFKKYKIFVMIKKKIIKNPKKSHLKMI